jgi:hypothetical protein
MLRILFVAATALALLVSAAEAYQGGDLILDKKDKFTKDDPGWQPNAKGDPLLKFITGNPHKVYTLKLTKGDKLLIRMKSVKAKEIDTLVAIEDSKKNILAYNDDDPDQKGKGTELDSKLVFTVPEDGDYRIIATVTHELVANKYGEFTLTVEKDKKK